ncbi:hypothetical protein Bca4012_051443 [Brassica carinata]
MNVEIKWRAWIPNIWIDVNTVSRTRGEIVSTMVDAVRNTPEKNERDNEHRNASDEDVVHPSDPHANERVDQMKIKPSKKIFDL